MGCEVDNCNMSKHVESVSICKFVVTFKKKKKTHNETPKPHISALVPFEGYQKNKFITSKASKYRERIKHFFHLPYVHCASSRPPSR